MKNKDNELEGGVDFEEGPNGDKIPPGQWKHFEGTTLYLKNIEGVMPCLCGDHPWTHNTTGVGKVEDGIQRDYLHCGLPRSGSTAVWQIMNELFPGKIVRSHGFEDACPMLYDYKNVVCCVRHPFDVYESMMRTGKDSYNVDEKFNEAMMALNKFVMLHNLKRYFPFAVRALNLSFIRYEDFYEKPEERVRALSQIFNLYLSPKEIKELSNKFTIDKNLERSSGLDGFSEINVESQIHGDHISVKRGKPFSSTISEEKKQIIEETYQWCFDYFEYNYY